MLVAGWLANFPDARPPEARCPALSWQRRVQGFFNDSKCGQGIATHAVEFREDNKYERRRRQLFAEIARCLKSDGYVWLEFKLYPGVDKRMIRPKEAQRNK